MSSPSGFRFIDEVDAQRQLGVDRLTFEELVRSKRLRNVSAGFFRATDVIRLRDELNPESVAEDVANASQPTDGSAPAPTPQPTVATEAKPNKAKKGHDPAMRVHLRLTADLKWCDINDSDIRAWFDQLRPDAYDRQRMNARFIISRMEEVLALIDAGEARLLSEAPPKPEA